MSEPESNRAKTATTRLTFIRHGEAYSNVARVIHGEKTCQGLTERGRKQAQLLGSRLRAEGLHDPVDAVYSTPLPRALQTAEIAALAIGLDVEHLPQWRYPEYGCADGQTWTQAYTAFGRRHPGRYPAMSPDVPLAEGAETTMWFRESMRQAIQALCERHQGEHLVLVGSTENIIACCDLMQGLPADARGNAKFTAGYTSLTRWDLEVAAWAPGGHRWTLAKANDVAHLHPAERGDWVRAGGTLGA